MINIEQIHASLPNLELGKQIALLMNLLALMDNSSHSDRYQAWIKFSALLIEYVWPELTSSDTSKATSAETPRMLSELYWSLHFLDTRISGEVPALGGIRLVRKTPPYSKPA